MIFIESHSSLQLIHKLSPLFILVLFVLKFAYLPDFSL